MVEVGGPLREGLQSVEHAAIVSICHLGEQGRQEEGVEADEVAVVVPGLARIEDIFHVEAIGLEGGVVGDDHCGCEWEGWGWAALFMGGRFATGGVGEGLNVNGEGGFPWRWRP